MSVYRVLVAHRGYQVGQVVEIDNPVRGYVKEIPNADTPESGDLARPADPGGDVLPRKAKRSTKPQVEELVDVADRTEPGSGPEDSES